MPISIDVLAGSCDAGAGVATFTITVTLGPGEVEWVWSMIGEQGPAQGFSDYGPTDGSGSATPGGPVTFSLAGLVNGRYRLTATTNDGQYVVGAQSEYLDINCQPAGTLAPRSQPYGIKIRHCPPAPGRPYYLRWQTWLGNWEGWLFSGEADTKVAQDAPVSLATEDGNTLAIAKPGAETLTLRAGNLSTAQHRAICTLVTAPQVYLQAQNGALTPVYVADNSAGSRTTTDSRHTFQVDIILPAANSLTN